MTEGFEEFIRQQFPFRPDHPDFQRLEEVVAQVERWKAEGTKPAKAYERLMDTFSVVYLAANRAGMNMPEKKLSPQELHIHMTDTWVEGFLYGVLFQTLGGHRESA